MKTMAARLMAISGTSFFFTLLNMSDLLGMIARRWL